MVSNPSLPVIVVGAGAAGLMAAIFAARAGVPVVVVETRAKPGAKIRVSGGGRCNILPSQVVLDDFHTSDSIHTMRNILFSWPLESVREFFERDLGIPLKVEPSGKIFPRSESSGEVVAALLRALRQSGAILQTSSRIRAIIHCDDGMFVLASADGKRLECRRLVLATGGLSLPKSGSDGAGLEMAIGLGHRRVPTYPALVPLLSSDAKWRALSGVSVRVRISVESEGICLEEKVGDFLFTHRGFSGPIILDLSRYVTCRQGNVALRVHWGGDRVNGWDSVLLARGQGTVGSALRRHLPGRLVTMLIDHAASDSSRRLSELKREERKRLVDTLSRFALPVAGSEGYTTAEVTGGGIPLAEISPATLESRVVTGLYFCGEILDVTGRLGGYNFLWAWVTGHKVGRALAAQP